MATKNTKLVEGIGFTSGGVFGEQLGAQVEIASGPKGDQGDPGPRGFSVNDVNSDQSGETVTITFSTNNPDLPDLPDVTFTVPEGTGGGDTTVTGVTLNDIGNNQYTFTFTLQGRDPVTTMPWTAPAGMNGMDGSPGPDGDSAFEIAEANGFSGTQAEWLESLEGMDGAPAPTITSVTVTEPTIGDYAITLGFSEGDPITSNTFTLEAIQTLDGLSDVNIAALVPGQGLAYNGTSWINVQESHVQMHADIPAGNQQQLQSITETTFDPDTGAQSSVVWVIEAITPAAPGDPTFEFSALPTQYGFADGDTITLTLTADTNTNSYFSALTGTPLIVTNVTSVSGGGEDPDDVWVGEVTSTQPGVGATNITELVVTLTSQTGASQIAGDFTVNMAIVVDNPTTHPADMFNRGYSFTIAEAADTTMAAAYTATTYTFDGNDHDDQTGTATLTVSDGVFVGAPTISASAGNLTLGTVTVNAANTIATVPYTITEPAAEAIVMTTLTWDATAQPVGATGTNGQTTTISGGVQIITVHGEPASNPTASGTPPADTSDSAFAIPPTLDFGIDSSSELGTGHYSYILANASGAYPSSGITELTGTNSATTTIQIPGTTAFPTPAGSGYESRGIQIGWSEGGNYTVVTNLEDTTLEAYHPILLWYNQTVTSAADITALYPATTMASTEVIIPSTAGIITGHTFTPTSGNFVMLLIPDTWQTVSTVSIVGDGNDQPLGVTVLPAGQITGIADSFGTSVLYQGFYVAGASPNVRLRIDSLS